MAVYPSGNPGVYPLDATSDTGKVRLMFGDTQSTAYDPVESGKQDYTLFSDDEIEAFLEVGETISGAVGWAYMQLAGEAARQSANIKDYDLQADLTKRSADLRAAAQFYFDMDAASSDDAFVIVPTGTRGTSDEFVPVRCSTCSLYFWYCSCG